MTGFVWKLVVTFLVLINLFRVNVPIYHKNAWQFAVGHALLRTVSRLSAKWACRSSSRMFCYPLICYYVTAQQECELMWEVGWRFITSRYRAPVLNICWRDPIFCRWKWPLIIILCNRHFNRRKWANRRINYTGWLKIRCTLLMRSR